jgi:hypothetical protein
MVGRPGMRLRKITVGAVLCMALFVAAPAYGQSSAQNGYSQPAGSVQQTLENKSNDGHRVQAVAQEESNSDSKLPFTGLDIALVVAAGGVLLAMGLGIRRLSRAEVA